MSDETTTEQLVEIEGQAADYPPPEGWRWLQIGEVIRTGDRWVRLVDGQVFDAYPNGQCVRHRRFIRRIEPQPEPEGSCPQLHPWLRTPPEQQADRIITPDDVAAEALAGVHDSAVVANPFQALRDLRRQLETTEAALLEQQQRNEQLVTQGSQQCMEIAELQAQVRFLKNRELTLGTRLEEEKAVNAKRLQQVEELRSEVSYVQGLLGTERRRVKQLEELVTSLRTINEAQEKAFNAAGKENTDLQHRLNVVAAEWAEQAETIRRLQIELDAAQQVPADSPELRQLRADLEQVTRERDEYRYAHDVLVKDANTVHERTKAMTVEAIAEWLEPIRLVDNPNLANETLQHLPQIMRHVTGLAQD